MYGQQDLSSTSIKTSRNSEGNVKKTKTLGKQNVKISSWFHSVFNVLGYEAKSSSSVTDSERETKRKDICFQQAPLEGKLYEGMDFVLV